MKFGAHYLPTYVPELDGSASEFYRRMFEQMELLDHLGFDQVWVTEHHFHEYGGTVPDPATFLAAVASRTTRVGLGIAIVILPLHDPLEVAESYAMVDVISGGRLNFGVGRGTAAELEQFGIGYEESVLRLREGTAIIQQGWAGEAAEFTGKLFNYKRVRVLPTPVQRPHPPFWVAASRSDDTYRWAGRQGFHLLTLPYMYEPEVLRTSIDHYREALVQAGHDPSTREVLGKFHIYVTDSAPAAVAEAGPYLQNYWTLADAQHHGQAAARRTQAAEQIARGNVIAGEPQRCIDLIRRWRDALGLTVVSGTFYFGGMPQEMALRNIRRFAREVMPAFAEAEAVAP
ncbi:MAG TPA: LLM class flavin-dependent oxidoreductase [Candidatus Tectomicrobia bacterium]|nr:LLM class flavin-dependent oxidoreductase [Candidatus Tectomicrobia bacterium]